MPFVEQGLIKNYVDCDDPKGLKPLLGPLAHQVCGCHAQEFQPVLEEVAERTGLVDPVLLIVFIDPCRCLLREGKLDNFLSDLEIMINRFGESDVVTALDVGCIKKDGGIMRRRLKDRMNLLISQEEI